MASWRKAWVQQKCGIAAHLASGQAGAGYPEAAILICATLSALSAELWSGRRIDRARFIELLVRLGPDHAFRKTISTPLLAQALDSEGRANEATDLRRAFRIPQSARILTGTDVDTTEDEVLRACPALGLEEVRRFSYACLLYEQVRSSYAHEYRPGDSSDSSPFTMEIDARVSYINRLVDFPNARLTRLIHFHIAWLSEVAVELAVAMDLQSTLPIPPPTTWWIQGG
jgi:hypothetical protein